MEELILNVDKLFAAAYDVGKKWDEDFESFKKNIENVVQGKKDPSLTPQQKKKVKRLSIIVDDEDSETSTQEVIVSQINQVVVKTEIIETSMARPSRAAKAKVSSFKEPSLMGKLRRPSNQNDTLSTTRLNNTTTIPEVAEKESNETESTAEKRSSDSKNIATKRSIEDDATGVPATSPEDEKNTSVDSAKKVDESLLILPNGEVPVLEISDSDAEKLMPPPPGIPKKKTVKKGKTSDSPERAPARSSRLRIKQEKLSLDQTNASAKDKANETESIKSSETLQDIKEERKSEEAETVKKTKSGKKPKKPYKCMPMKEERLSSKPDEQPSQTSSSRQTRNKTKQNSLDSVYEDAVTDNAIKSTANEQQQQQDQDTTYHVPPTTRSSKELPPDNTFVSAKDGPAAEPNATFVSAADGEAMPETNATFVSSNCPQKTFVMENAADQTKVISTGKQVSGVDATFSINNETFQAAANGKQHADEMNIMRSSIMTEEDSADEMFEAEPLPKHAVLKASHKKELFNPCIQSPVKKKVEAFEKHATAMASPAMQRQTRNKGKLKENKDPESLSKLTTPNAMVKRDISKLLTPQFHTNVTPNHAIPSNLKKYSSSTSKLSQIQKPLTKSTSSLTSKTSSQSRDNSSEDLKRAGTYGSKLQQLADEKKKKREQKQQQAALAREAKEQERLDKMKKTMQEKEEKRRKAQQQQLEMKKHLDDMNRHLKLQEEESQRKIEKKQLEYELAEAARKERERLDNLRIQKAKDELQSKLLENQRLEQEKRAAAKKAKEAQKFDWDNLNSGDSTDEEGKTASKRPPPPIWSKSSIRQMIIDRQSELNTKIVDRMFSVQPLSPDLREIFPAIDPRFLKRNSSMYWNTPPRYSQLPKY